MTTIYLVRHAEPLQRKPIRIENSDDLQTWNEKSILSINGEQKAEQLSKTEQMQNIDLVISSQYVRAISTAKYISNANDKDLYIMESFGERKFGITSWDELPLDFETKQIEDPTYKIGKGESQIEVANRMYDALLQVLNANQGKRIAIISHATAITFLLMKLCEHKNNSIYFNNKVVLNQNHKWKAPEIFKLNFSEDNHLVNIENIRE